jgi:hypothetical protein
MLYAEQRVLSLRTRLESEDLMGVKALTRPGFGAGGWGRMDVYDFKGRKVTIPDGLWIIAMGQNGLVGLIALALSYLGPVCLLLRSRSAASLTSAALAPAGAVAMVVVLYWIDSLSNAMINPILVTGMGALAGFASASAGERVKGRRRKRRRAAAPHPGASPPGHYGPRAPIPTSLG